MSVGGWAFAGYLAWLAAGFVDFTQHRRTDLPHTSGLRESVMHGVQLGLLGLVVLSWLLFAPGLGLRLLLGVLVLLHAVAGYIDTLSAFGRRTITPLEQHVHSVMDMAPWIALGVVVLVQGGAAREAGWPLQLDPALPRLWLAALLPALLLCVAPWLHEFGAVLRARGA
ncbi:putative transmembrane protein [Pseudoxanthomonas suwonensis 11-1]|uniref:Putative transmembrane protein n=1 Tax=Pseudoxanthomonas suwonensis (strain 11-1) TaxID=743721 RepID=E6WWZ7_PSEUU|nr:hypothetical protein [Pseudoxanthomonas suwonensis]ADV28696.1 putative transmembrane protein [Pseudoxanthomonas suwonensis 11-1]